MNDDDRLLASAALDGVLTDEERTRVDADAALRDEIDRLARVRDVLGATAAPDPARRETVIAAALAAAATPAAPVAPVVPIGTRRRWMAPVVAAAAIVAIGVGAVVVTQGGDGGGDDAALVAPAATEVAADRLTATREAADTAAPDVTERASAAVPPAPADDASSEAGGATEMTEEATEPTTAAASEGQVGLDELAPDGVVVLRSAEDLRAFAVIAISTPSTPAADTDGPRCDGGRWLGTARYAGAGGERPVEVFVDADRVMARDAGTCEIVLEVRN